MTVLHFGFRLISGFESSLPDFLNLLSPFALVIQVSFLIMIFRITWLKDNLKSKSLENQSLVAYSSGLEKNMDGIRNIKHDLKNIFLTMGSFVEQSGNPEIQAFYREKISPFANEEIVKSDLYGKLAAIDNEQLKAFMFYKITQAVERGIDVDLDISPRFPDSKKRMEFTDLVRVLGIFFDNAIEECMELEHGKLAVRISCNDDIVSYIIKNTVSPERKANGIRPNVSSKGSGRGAGLLIVRGILEDYDRVTLNSYFQDDCFVQNLVQYE
jgi:sensor histidine kinase regulating citrate/malate metabolism